MCSLNEAKLFANYTVWAGFVNLELRLWIFKATIKRLLGLLGHLLCTGQYCLLVKKTSVQKPPPSLANLQFGLPISGGSLKTYTCYVEGERENIKNNL